MPPQRKTFANVSPNITNVQSYISRLDELIKRNTGQGLHVGEDTSSNTAMYIPGRVSDPTGLGQGTAQYVQPSQAPVPVDRSGGQYMYDTSNEANTPSIEEFLYSLEQQSPAPQRLNSEQAKYISDQTGKSYGLQSLQDDGKLYSDNVVRYDDGSERQYDKARDSAYGVASDISGSTRYSDNSLRKLNDQGQAYGIQSRPDGTVLYSDGSIRKMSSPGSYQSLTPKPIQSIDGNNVLYDDGAVRSGAQQTYTGPTGTGEKALSQFIFGGKDQAITQKYGNYNPGVEITKDAINYGTDFRTRDLQGAARDIKLPVGATVVKVSANNSYNSGYGNSVLLQFANGEQIRLSHLSDVGDLRPGQKITANTYIGKPGTTGNTRGEHLDVEYRDTKGNFINPLQFNPQSIAQAGGETYQGNIADKNDLTGSSIAGLTGKKRAFIEKYSPLAKDIEERYGIPAAVTLAQAALESGWNPDARTLFGIKGTGDAGSAAMGTKEQGENGLYGTSANFAQYSSPEAAFEAYAKLLTTNPRYAAAMEAARRGDIQGTIQGIKDGGYATDNDYVSKIMATIGTNGLDQLSAPQIAANAPQASEAPRSFMSQITPQAYASDNFSAAPKQVSGLQSVQPKKLPSSNPFRAGTQTVAKDIGTTLDTNTPLNAATGGLGIGLSEKLQGDTQGANTELAKTLETVGAKSKLPELGVSEAAAQGGITGAANQLKNVFTDTIKNAATTLKGSAATDVLGKAGQGIAQLAGSGVSSLENVFKPKQETTSRAVGDVAGSSTDPANPRLNSLMDNASSLAGLAKNDIRDTFFKQGGAQSFSSFLKPNAESSSGGALGLNIFNDNIYENKDNLGSVFGGTKFINEAANKYVDKQKQLRPQLTKLVPFYGIDPITEAQYNSYNTYVDTYNANLNNAINSEKSSLLQSKSSFIPSPKQSVKSVFSGGVVNALRPVSSSFSSATPVSQSVSVSRPTSSSVSKSSSSRPSSSSTTSSYSSPSYSSSSSSRSSSSSTPSNANYSSQKGAVYVAPKSSSSSSKSSSSSSYKPAPAKAAPKSTPSNANYSSQKGSVYVAPPKSNPQPAQQSKQSSNIFTKVVSAIKNIFRR